MNKYYIVYETTDNAYRGDGIFHAEKLDDDFLNKIRNVIAEDLNSDGIIYSCQHICLLNIIKLDN
jgi:hypothetical protein